MSSGLFATSTPTPFGIPQSDGSAFIDTGWLHASVTPTPNDLVLSDGSGHISPDWLVRGNFSSPAIFQQTDGTGAVFGTGVALTLSTQAAALVWAGPVTGTAAAPTFRALALTDINTALSTWTGSANLATVGTIATGTWHGTAVADTYIASASTWNGKQAAYANLTSFGSLANASGWLKNNGTGTLSYSTPTKSDVGLGSVENTALSTWAGSTSLTTLGTLSALSIGSPGVVMDWDIHNGLNFFGSTDNNMMSWKNTGVGASAIRYLDVSGIELGAFGYGGHSGTVYHPFCDMMYLSIGGGSSVANGGHPTSFAVVNDNTGMNSYVQFLLKDTGELEYRAPGSSLIFSSDNSGNTLTAGIATAAGMKSTAGVNFYAPGFSSTPAIFTNSNNQIGFGTNAPNVFAHFKRDNCVIKLESTVAGDTGFFLLGSSGQLWAFETGRADIFGADSTFGIYCAGLGSVFQIDSSVGDVVVKRLKTGDPSGGTAKPWRLGNYTAGIAVQAGKVRVEINGTPYDLLTA